MIRENVATVIIAAIGFILLVAVTLIPSAHAEPNSYLKTVQIDVREVQDPCVLVLYKSQMVNRLPVARCLPK